MREFNVDLPPVPLFAELEGKDLALEVEDYNRKLTISLEEMFTRLYNRTNFVGVEGLVYGEIHAHGITTALTSESVNDWDQIVAFDTNGLYNGATPDHTNDHITVLEKGKYLVSFTWCGYGPAAVHDWAFHPAKNGGTVFDNVAAHPATLAAQKDVNLSSTGIIDLAEDDTIELWVKRLSAGNNIILTTTHCVLLLAKIGREV